MNLLPSSRVRRIRENFVDVVVDGELVIMHVQEARFTALHGVERRVWEHLAREEDDHVEASAVVAGLCEEFEVDADTCLRDVSVLIGQLRDAGLVEVDGAEKNA